VSDDLDFDFALTAPWFPHAKDSPYVLVRVSSEHAQSWADSLGLTIRRCYVSDSIINARATELGVDKSQIIAARLPDAGATMAGDFGEILVYFYQGAQELPAAALGAKKWRLKQDRTKGTFNPIKSAIEDGAKDRTSRLARTLVWLRERAMSESLDDIQLAHLDRFINATDHPPAKKRFRAVAVVCQSLVEEELKNAPRTALPEYTVVVIAVPDLKKTYSAVFAAARNALPPVTRHKSVPPSAPETTAK
jgi:hypothetical protein